MKDINIDALAKDFAKRKAMRGKDIMYGYDTVVQCKKCGHKEYLEFINGLRNGWNQCCGQTMPILKTTANIQEVMHKLLKGMGI